MKGNNTGRRKSPQIYKADLPPDEPLCIICSNKNKTLEDRHGAIKSFPLEV